MDNKPNRELAYLTLLLALGPYPDYPDNLCYKVFDRRLQWRKKFFDLTGGMRFTYDEEMAWDAWWTRQRERHEQPVPT